MAECLGIAADSGRKCLGHSRANYVSAEQPQRQIHGTKIAPHSCLRRSMDFVRVLSAVRKIDLRSGPPLVD
jgi:hypothetical protein